MTFLHGGITFSVLFFPIFRYAQRRRCPTLKDFTYAWTFLEAPKIFDVSRCRNNEVTACTSYDDICENQTPLSAAHGQLKTGSFAKRDFSARLYMLAPTSSARRLGFWAYASSCKTDYTVVLFCSKLEIRVNGECNTSWNQGEISVCLKHLPRSKELYTNTAGKPGQRNKNLGLESLGILC